MEAIIGVRDFISHSLRVVDAVVVKFVETGFKLMVANNLGIITAIFTLCVISYGFRGLYFGASLSIEELTKKLLLMVVVYSLATKWDLFNVFFYEIFSNQPYFINKIMLQMYSDFNGESNGALILDNIFYLGMEQTGKLFVSGITGKLHALFVALATFLMCLGALALMLYAKLALAILLFLGPLFLLTSLFKITIGYFKKWVELLLNFALIPILTCALLMLIHALIDSTLPGLKQASELNSGGFYAIIPFIAISLVCAFLYKQILGIAAALSSGLVTYGMDFTNGISGRFFHEKFTNNSSNANANNFNVNSSRSSNVKLINQLIERNYKK